MSDRFYCPEPPRECRYQIRADEARHLVRVLRHNVGDIVELFDGNGFATMARVIEIAKHRVDLVAEGAPIPEALPTCSLTLATAIPKGDRLDWLVEKATELGVARLIPLITERSVVDPREAKLERQRRAIIEASKQCRRNRLMVLETAHSWPDLMRLADCDVRLIAAPSGLQPARWPVVDKGQQVVLAVGPEGGFTPSEIDLAISFKWFPIRLSHNMLRIETAGLAGAAAILTRCEEQNDDAVA
jgi:16S rRNA (uracil1498-N3)-methyltransferase